MKDSAKLALLGILLIPSLIIGYRFNVDLVNIHYAAQLLFSDVVHTYGPNQAPGRFFYPPISLVFFKPFGTMSYLQVKLFWLGLQTISFFAFWHFIERMYPYLSKPGTALSWFAVWIMAINPIHNNFQSNNIQLMLIAALMAAEWLSYSSIRGLQFLAGFICMLTAGIKIFPLFIVAFYLVQKPRAVRWGIYASALFCVFFPFAFFGVDNAIALYKGFFTNVTSYGDDNNVLKVGDILCLPSMVTRWFSVGLETPTFVPWLNRALIIGISGVFFLSVIWLKRTSPNENKRQEFHLWAFANALMVFLNPSTRPHYFIFYVPAFCSLLEKIHASESARRVAPLLLVPIGLIAFTAEGVLGKHLNDHVEMHNYPTFGMIALLALTAWYVYRRREWRPL